MVDVKMWFQFSVSVWYDVIDWQLTGPSFFKGQLTGAIYVGSLEHELPVERCPFDNNGTNVYLIWQWPTCHLTRGTYLNRYISGQQIGHAVHRIGCDHWISIPLISCSDAYETSCFWLRTGYTRGLNSLHWQCSHSQQWPWHSLMPYTLYCKVDNNVYQSWWWLILNIFLQRLEFRISKIMHSLWVKFLSRINGFVIFRSS